jgi:hypothetical protein
MSAIQTSSQKERGFTTKRYFYILFLLLRNGLIIRKTGGESELLIQANLKTPDKNTKYGKESSFLYQISKREERK